MGIKFCNWAFAVEGLKSFMYTTLVDAMTQKFILSLPLNNCVKV